MRFFMYITPEKAREWLILSGTYTEESAPSLASLEFLIRQLEPRFDLWLGYSAGGVKVHRQRRRTNRQGQVFLNFYPVLSIESVHALWEVDPNNPSLPAKWEEISCMWRGEIFVSTEYPHLLVEVVYTAGFDPVPPIFGNTFFQLLRQSLQNTGTTGDLSFLDEPIRDVSSISVPGISKSFRLSDPSKGSSLGENNQLDRLMSPLASLRRKYLY